MPPSVHEYWEKIDTLLNEVAPWVYETLAPPATDAEIAYLQEKIPLDIPPAFIDSLRIHNGQLDESRFHPFFDYQHLLSCQEIVAGYDMHCSCFEEEEVLDFIDESSCKLIKRNLVWSQGWLPFTESEGDCLVLDLDPGPAGKAGQVFFRPHDDSPAEIIITTSYRDWLAALTEKLEKGMYQVDDDILLINNFTFQD